MAAREDQAEPFVGNPVHVVLLVRRRLQPGEQLALARQRLLAPQPVDRAVARRRDDPRARIGRDAVTRPALERCREGLLNRVLGEVEVAEDAGQDGDRAAPLVAVDPSDRLDPGAGSYRRASASAGIGITGRTSIEP
jgi:hypothetical protein